MALESATFISGLNSSNPVGASDPKSQGDDHLRLIKATLLNSFPGVTGAVTATHTELNFIDGATGVSGTGNTIRSASPTFTGTLLAAAITASGTITGNLFSGSGASLTALNGSNISSGTVADARIAATLARLASPTFTGTVNAAAITASGTVTGNLFSGSGASLTALNASNISSGTLAADRLPSEAVQTSGAQSIAGIKTFTDGIQLNDGDTLHLGTGDDLQLSATGTTGTIDAPTRLNITGGTVSVGESGAFLGFFGDAGTTIPTITGTTRDGAGNPIDALVDLLASLAAMGLIVDSST
ncbi:MAG: hypothetical protein WD795_16370 [Woeseia sp.]